MEISKRSPARHMHHAVLIVGFIVLIVGATPVPAPPGLRPPPDDDRKPVDQGSEWEKAVSSLLVCSIIACLYAFLREFKLLRVDTLRHAQENAIPLICMSITSIVAILRAVFDYKPAAECEPIQASTDIAGIGVLVGLYVPVGLATTSLIAGHFMSGDTGTKELGIVMLASK